MKWKFWTRTTPASIEKRRARRITVSVYVVVGVENAHYVAETDNLSETGLRLHTKQAFPVGTRLRMVFGDPPGLPKVDVEGVVKWAEEGKAVGVEFTSLSPEQRKSLLDFLNSRC